MSLPKRIGKVLTAALVVLAMVLTMASATGGLQGSPQDDVLTEPIILGSIQETVLANGVLEPARMVSVGAQVSGQLKSLHVRLGQTIKTGDLIAEIDSTPQSNALRIAEAALANVGAQRKARGIQLRQAEHAWQRQKTLNAQKVTSIANLETAEANFEALEAEVEALEAQIAQATVEVENARANLAYTKVRAPMDGIVVAVVTKVGQTLNSSQMVPTIAVLAQLEVMKVKVQISEADIARVRPGQKIWFTILGDTRTRTDAILEQIEPAPTSIATESSVSAATTGQTAAPAVYYNGLFSTPNTAGRLRPMMTAIVRIVVGEVQDAPLVAWSALTERDEEGRYRVRIRSLSGEIADRLVTIGLTDRIRAQVLDGLAVGDNVVIPADGQATNPGDMVMM